MLVPATTKGKLEHAKNAKRADISKSFQHESPAPTGVDIAPLPQPKEAPAESEASAGAAPPSKAWPPARRPATAGGPSAARGTIGDDKKTVADKMGGQQMGGISKGSVGSANTSKEMINVGLDLISPKWWMSRFTTLYGLIWWAYPDSEWAQPKEKKKKFNKQIEQMKQKLALKILIIGGKILAIVLVVGLLFFIASDPTTLASLEWSTLKSAFGF